MGDLVVHVHDLLLVGGRQGSVHAREHLNCSEFSRETLPVHQSLNHAHDDVLKVTDSDAGENFLHALNRLFKTIKLSAKGH